MMDEIFLKMSQEKVNDWSVALLGVSGIPTTSERLSVPAVTEFAKAELEQLAVDDSALDLVVELATEEPLSSADMRDCLARVCDIKNVDLEQSKHKWQLFSVQDLLETLDPDPVYGMIALSEFWHAWDWPADSPASMRADIEPAEYHSDAHYLRVVDDHRQWLARHMEAVRG